jgi:26S proteasome regulatory subunit N5
MSNVGSSGRASGGELEEKVDLSEKTSAKLEQSQALAQSGQLTEALALLAALEKKCRVGNDNESLVKACEASLQYCKDANDSDTLISTLQTLATRRSQKMQAIRALVQKAMPWCVSDNFTPIVVSNTDERNNRDKLVVSLRDITDGKIFLEGERARLTRALAIIKVRFIALSAPWKVQG